MSLYDAAGLPAIGNWAGMANATLIGQNGWFASAEVTEH
jgi:hypothetical protein